MAEYRASGMKSFKWLIGAAVSVATGLFSLLVSAVPNLPKSLVDYLGEPAIAVLAGIAGTLLAGIAFARVRRK